jgi:hypothetical protein
MVSKIEIAQPVFDYRKHNLQKPKDGLKKKESASFASVLENTIKSQSTAINSLHQDQSLFRLRRGAISSMPTS